jgi:hypothetical protein
MATTGLFETSWVEISKDVKKWGRIAKSIDSVRYSKVKFNDVNMTMANDYGSFNPEDDESSLWFGYASQQRTLVKIEAGFTHQTLGSNGIWTNTEYPTNPVAFIGFIYGDISTSDNNEVMLPVKPLFEVFRTFATVNLTGYTTTGMTAKQFIHMLRDQTDGSSNFIFRPFFQETTTYWDITSSAIIYPDIRNTATSVAPGVQSNDFYEKNCWDVIEKLGEAEDLVPYVTRDGTFTFSGRDPNTATAAFEFFGRGFFDRNYGSTIKKISRYGKKMSSYYSRVEVKWIQTHTTTAIVSTQSAMVVSGSNDPWNYGHRIFQIQNYWIQTITSARTLCNSIFNTVSALKDEIAFSTSFVPHLELLDLVEVSYESNEKALSSRWDLSDWAENTTTTDLVWALQTGDAIRFSAKEFKLISIELDLDNFESRFVGTAI